jgi:hypothetical protein
MLLTTITQVVQVPKMKNSLIFVSKFISKGLKVKFDKDGCNANNVHGIVVAKACREKNLYFFNVNVRKENANVAKFLNEGAMFWHQKLGHLNMVNLKKLEKMVNDMNLKKMSLCVKLALKANIKGRIFLKMKQSRLQTFGAYA